MIDNKWVVLVASTLINFTMSYTYTWSVFSTPLMELFGWTAAAAAITFTLTGVMGPFSQILGGGLLNRFGIRKTMFCSIIVFAASMFAAGYTSSIGWLYMTYGAICAFSMSICYICNLTNVLRFFDDRRGMASGILTSGAGFSSVVTAPVAQHLIVSFGVLATFKIFGIAYIVILLVLFLFIREAPLPDDSANAGDTQTDRTRSYTPLEMVRTVDFYILLILYAAGATGGLMVIGQTANMALEMIGTTATTAALAVSIVAIGNALGRIVWGVISDRLGRYNTLPFLFLFMTGLFIVFNLFCRDSLAMFLIVIVFIGLCFGGIPSMFPAFTLDRFGPKYNGSNYGCMFFGYAIGAFAGPVIGAAFKDSGSAPYSVGLIVAALICILGFALSMVLRYRHKIST